MAPKWNETADDGAAWLALRRSPRLDAATRAPHAAAQLKQPMKKKSKTVASATPKTAKGSKTIIIEHCKQCKSFKTRAERVKKGLEKDLPNVSVVVNPENPRRGCFEIRGETGEIFLSFLDMDRPFKPMKELVMKDVISNIVAKIR